MWRFNWLYSLLKLQCLVLDVAGLFKLKFNRAHQRYRLRHGFWTSLVTWFPCFLLLFVNFVQFTLHFDEDDSHDASPDARPELKGMGFFSPFAQNMAYVWILVMYLNWRIHLWYMVDQAQLVYKHLRQLLRERFVLECSWLLLLLGILQLLLLLLLSIKFVLEDFLNDANIVMGIIHLLLMLLLSLQFFQHLLHTGMLQSLNQLIKQLKLPAELNLLHQVLHVYPLLKRIQHLRAYYFSLVFCWLLLMLSIKCGAYVSALSYEENMFFQRHKNRDIIEHDADRHELAALDLAWPISILLLLLSAAKLQQREQQKLINNIWNIKFPGRQPEISPRAFNKSRHNKDTISFLLRTRLSLVDYRTHSMSFLAWKPKAYDAVYSLADIVRGCILLLQVVLFSTIVDYVHQMD